MTRDHMLGFPSLATWIADAHEPMRQPHRTPWRGSAAPNSHKADDKRITAALKAPKQTFKCDTCEDTGECMQMVCYGGPPVERMGECPDCKARVKLPYQPAKPLAQAADELIDGAVYRLEFTGGSSGRPCVTTAMWTADEGWRYSGATRPVKYLNGVKSPNGHYANVKVLGLAKE